MSRVAQLDSSALDQEINSLFWTDFTRNFAPQKNKEQWQLLVETLVFYFGSKSGPDNIQTTTYGSQLSGVKYGCKKRTLFLITILSRYLNSSLSHLLFSHNTSTWLLETYKYLCHLYSALDLLNFAHFLLGSRLTGDKYLTPLHRLFKTPSYTDTLNPINFYHDTVYAGIEYQNRQLLWNAILELFNVTLLNNTRWLNRQAASKHPATQKSRRGSSCPRCAEFPTNPYTISCCKANYCYLCVVKALELSQCNSCQSNRDLEATPLY